MSIESWWYSDFRDGKPPRCSRLCRMDMQFQFLAAVEIAIDFSMGIAGYRVISITLTREKYWYWAHPQSKTGWWLIPDRVERRAMHLLEMATKTALKPSGSCQQDAITQMLIRWKKNGHWRNVISHIAPRRGEEMESGYGQWLASLLPKKGRGKLRKKPPITESKTILNARGNYFGA